MDVLALDSVDRALLEVLQQEGRITNAELATRVQLSPSACLRRVRALEKRGAIEGYRAVLAPRRIGLGLTVFVEIKVERHSTNRAASFEEAFASMPEVVSAHIVSGDADFLLEVVVPDLEAYQQFLLGTLLQLPGLTDVRSNMAIKTLRCREPLPLNHLES
ncbi:MAG TPA: Lrp/AsnC family transcriptional regulator [Gaiellaceae bacterium]|jgi:Lrp/AsnC family leucine-responsive transcriptional regulator|nr:Lrp/AsnC family transcriptional regulator [Gaiellaceae bacterium]